MGGQTAHQTTPARRRIGQRTAATIRRLRREDHSDWKAERLLVWFLDVDHRVLGVRELPVASLTVPDGRLPSRFRALRIPRRTAAFACLHSVPPAASSEACAHLAKRLQQIGTALGVPLLDYVVFRDGRCRSLSRGARLP